MLSKKTDSRLLREERKKRKRKEQRERARKRKKEKILSGAERTSDGAENLSNRGVVQGFDLNIEFGQNEGTLSDWLNPKHQHFRKDFQNEWKNCFNSDLKKAFIQEDKTRIKKLHVSNVKFPFVVNSDDHCETSPEAYEDIVPILKSICEAKGLSRNEVALYDPYYCNGAVIRHFAKLGFKNVYNRCEDFYDTILKQRVPKYDILVTNPPYSDYHVKRLLEFSTNKKIPCLLLLPSYVADKPYFKKFCKSFKLVCPRKRYVYWTPKGLRGKEKKQNHASSLGTRTSPFPSFWYINLFHLSDAINLEELYHSQKETIKVVVNRSGG